MFGVDYFLVKVIPRFSKNIYVLILEYISICDRFG